MGFEEATPIPVGLQFLVLLAGGDVIGQAQTEDWQNSRVWYSRARTLTAGAQDAGARIMPDA